MSENQPLFVPPSGGKHLGTMGMLMTVKASARDTGDAFAVMHVVFPPNIGPPLHVHNNESELNYVVDGEMRFRCGDEEFTTGPGGFVYLPRGSAHAFKSGPDGAKMLAVTSPGGLEELYERVGDSAAEMTLPSSPPNVAGWLEHAASFGLEVVGPPLD